MQFFIFLFFILFQTILNQFNKIIRLFYKRLKRKNSACIERIVFRHRAHPLEFSRGTHFATFFWEYVEFVSVLQMKNVTIYEITNDEVILVMLPKNLHAYNNVRVPFFHDACFKEATNIIRISVDNFNELIQTELGSELYCKIAILHNVGRCGSTLVCHMLAAANPTKILVFSEHDFLLGLHALRSTMANLIFARLLRNCFIFITYRIPLNNSFPLE